MNSNQSLAQELHKKALNATKKYLEVEAELLEIIQQIDRTKAFRELAYSSMHAYCTQALNLTDAVAYNFIAVARKAVLVPELKQEIDRGELSVNQARKIVSILTPDNQQEWIEKAKTLSLKRSEKE